MRGTAALGEALAAAGVSCRATEPPGWTGWLSPRLVAEPTTPADLARTLGAASEVGAAVIPVGSWTKIRLGNPPRAADLLLSTTGLNRVIEYEPANLTVIVESGVVVRDLQAKLAEKGQFLPLGDLAGTVGGVVAANASGPLRLGYGTARDLLIGSRIATSDGRLARAGGKVVKNVAGYDLGKLYVGSLGTLGVLVELAFKLAPLPASRATHLSAHAGPAAAQEMAKRLLRSSLQPLAADLLSPAASAALGLLPPRWTLAVLVGGVPSAAPRQLDELGKLALGVGGDTLGVLEEPASDDLWRRVTSLGEGDAYLQLKASVPIAEVAAAAEALSSAAPSLGAPPVLWARAGSGIVYASWAAAPERATASVIAEGLARARRQLASLGGALVFEKAPREVVAGMDVWGEVGESLAVMRALKAQFDPRGTLNPGRFVGGI